MEVEVEPESDAQSEAEEEGRKRRKSPPPGSQQKKNRTSRPPRPHLTMTSSGSGEDEVENEARYFAQNQWKTRERREQSQKSRQVQRSQEGLHTHYYNNGAKRVDTAVSDAEKVGKLKEKLAEGSLDLIKLNGMTLTVLRFIEEHLSAELYILCFSHVQGPWGDKEGDHPPHTKL